MKKCTICKQEKDLTEFYIRKDRNIPCYFCKECNKTKIQEWRKVNPARHIAKVREWQKKNPEKVKCWDKISKERNSVKVAARKAKYYRANSEVFKARSKIYGKAWRKENPDKHCAKQAGRRAMKLQATPAWANQKYIELWYEHCKLEEQRTGKKCHVDHIVPLKNKLVCGLHNEFNLQVLFVEDNLKKHNSFEAI